MELENKLRSLHRPIETYNQCPVSYYGCNYKFCTETNDGLHIHTDQPTGPCCEECHDEDGHLINYPCPTIKLLS